MAPESYAPAVAFVVVSTREPSETAVKFLFANSRNVCFFNLPDVRDSCENRLTDRNHRRTNGEIAHICADAPRGPRYDPKQSDEERQAEPNLMLLCPGCHKRIDDLEPERFTVQMLLEMKERHLNAGGDSTWRPREEYVAAVARDMMAYLVERRLPEHERPQHAPSFDTHDIDAMNNQWPGDPAAEARAGRRSPVTSSTNVHVSANAGVAEATATAPDTIAPEPVTSTVDWTEDDDVMAAAAGVSPPYVPPNQQRRPTPLPPQPRSRRSNVIAGSPESNDVPISTSSTVGVTTSVDAVRSYDHPEPATGTIDVTLEPAVGSGSATIGPDANDVTEVSSVVSPARVDLQASLPEFEPVAAGARLPDPTMTVTDGTSTASRDPNRMRYRDPATDPTSDQTSDFDDEGTV